MPDITTILATDCGSTTTKAILIEKRGKEYRLVCRRKFEHVRKQGQAAELWGLIKRNCRFA